MPNNLKQPTDSPSLRQAKVKEGMLGVRGEVTEALPGTTFKVLLESGEEILAYLSGRMRQNYIRVSLGDTVVVELNPNEKPFDSTTRGRIIFREK